jgi:hypothetical protein
MPCPERLQAERLDAALPAWFRADCAATTCWNARFKAYQSHAAEPTSWQVRLQNVKLTAM